MNKTFGCQDIGFEDCSFRMPLSEGEDRIVESALTHAKTIHPAIAADPVGAETTIRSHLAELMRQAKYADSQTDGLY